MQKSGDLYKVSKVSFVRFLENKLLLWFRLTNSPVIKVYNGYGNSQLLIIFGHVFKLSPLPRKKYRRNFITNFFSMLRLFMVRPYTGALVKLDWDGVIYETRSEDDGFFRFECAPANQLKPGKHKAKL